MPKSHAKSGPQAEPQWLILNDFSPGIHQRVMYQGGSNSPSQIFGAATENTWRCIALPSGGLGPLPKRDYTYDPSRSALDSIANVANGRYTISGFHVSGPILTNSANGQDNVEFHIAYEYLNTNTSKRRYQWQRHRMWEATPTIDSLKNITSTEATPSSTYRVSTMHNYRSDSSSATAVGLPQVVNGWYAGGGSDEKLWAIYPDPGAPTTNNLKDVTTTLAIELALGHQGRSVAFNQVPYSHGSSGTWSSNEQVFFTNSNLPTLASTTASVFGQENVTGYGVAATLNAQELLLIKRQGGAYLIRGDIANPTVIRLPGVISTGGETFQGASTPIGFLYISQNLGAWCWNGGEVSELISPQLEGNFYKAGMTVDMQDYKGRAALFGEWVLFPNNWVYAYRTQSWWKIENPSTVRILQWSLSIGPVAYGAVATCTDSGAIIHGFTASTPASSYQWESQPVAQTVNRLGKIRELIVIAQGTGTVVTTLTAADGTTASYTATLSGSTNVPQPFRFNTNIEGSYIKVKIVADNGSTGSAPIVYEVRMDWVEQAQLASS